MTVIGTIFNIPITGFTAGADAQNLASFDFATANTGGTNLDNSVVTLKSNLIIATSTFSAGFMARRDAVAKRSSGTVTLLNETNGFGPGSSVVIFSGDAAIQSFIASFQYQVSGTQVILRIVTSGGAGSFVYGGRMIGFTDK